MKKNKRKYTKRYFIKVNSDSSSELSIVKDDFFEDLTKAEALCFGLFTYLEVKRTLKDDAINGNSYIGNMKVITGLERFLNKLEQKFPTILTEINGMSLRCDGLRLFKC